MNKAEIANRVYEILKENDYRKATVSKKFKFQITDEDGHAKDFSIMKKEHPPLLNKQDITAVIDALMLVIEEALRTGEEFSLRGLITVRTKRRKGRWVYHPETGEPVEVEERYVPAVLFGNKLKIAAKLYGQDVDNGILPKPEKGDD